MQRMGKKVMWSLVLSAFSLGSVSYAAEAGTKITASEIKVTATRVERDIQEVPISVDVVDAQTITRSGATTVAEALRDIPGVTVHDGSMPGAKRVFIRGESGARVLIMIDGQKTSEQKSMTGAVFLIDPAMIERIEVIKGPGSVLYGSEAIGGVVNIITKKGGNKPISLTTSVTYDGSTSGHREYLSLFGKVDRLSYRLSATQSDHDKRQTPDDGKLEKTQYEEQNYSAYVDYAWDDFTIGGQAEKYDGELAVFTPEGTVSSAMYGMKHFHQDLPEWSREKYSVFFDARNLGDTLTKVSGSAYTQKVKKDFIMKMDVHTPITTPPPPFATMIMQSRNRTVNDQTTNGFLLQSDWTLGDSHYLIAGFEYTQDKLTANEHRNSSVKMGAAPAIPSSNLYVDEAQSDIYAIYAQDEWSLPNDVVLSIGGRQTWIDAGLESSTNPALTPESSKESNLVGALGLTWSGLENTVLRASFSQGFRFGTLQQLYMGTVHGSATPTYHNPNLKPETSNNFEVGADYRHDGITLSGALFVSEAKDYITTVKVAGGSQFDNVDKASTHGAEASVSYQISDFTPYASGLYLKRKFKSATQDTDKTGYPSLEGKAGVRYDNSGSTLDWYTDFFLRMASGAEKENTDGTTDEYSGYTTLNLGAGVKFGEKRQYGLALNFNNIGDRKYETFQESVPNAGRHIVATFEATF